MTEAREALKDIAQKRLAINFVKVIEKHMEFIDYYFNLEGGPYDLDGKVNWEYLNEIDKQKFLNIARDLMAD